MPEQFYLAGGRLFEAKKLSAKYLFVLAKKRQ